MFERLLDLFKQKKIDEVTLETSVKRGLITKEQKAKIMLLAKGEVK